MLKDCVKGQVHFEYFRDGALWYRCDNGFLFQVPITDTGSDMNVSATFPAIDKGIFYMRWIRKELDRQAETNPNE